MILTAVVTMIKMMILMMITPTTMMKRRRRATITKIVTVIPTVPRHTEPKRGHNTAAWKLPIQPFVIIRDFTSCLQLSYADQRRHHKC